MSTSQSQLIFIGSSSINPDHTFHINSLTTINPSCIKAAYSINAFTIYTDQDMNNIWITRFNSSILSPSNPISESQILTEKITFFNNNNIKIKKICGNINSHPVFFITNKNELYAYGYNQKDLTRFSIPYNTNNKTDPQLISSLKNVINVQANPSCMIALCISSSFITKTKQLISIWTQTIKYMIFPTVIIDLIASFSNKRVVFSSTDNVPTEFYEMNVFGNVEIVKICACWRRTFFLDIYGYLWCWCKWNVNDAYCTPHRVTYFVENGVRIKDVECGFGHILVLDYDGNMYSCGCNSYGQCGDGNCYGLIEPVKIDCEYIGKVVVIKCGTYHSYCKTIDGKHFMWGSNDNFECVVDDKYIYSPIRIDQVLMDEYDKEIIDVFLGHFNTKILCV